MGGGGTRAGQAEVGGQSKGEKHKKSYNYFSDSHKKHEQISNKINLQNWRLTNLVKNQQI